MEPNIWPDKREGRHQSNTYTVMYCISFPQTSIISAYRHRTQDNDIRRVCVKCRETVGHVLTCFEISKNCDSIKFFHFILLSDSKIPKLNLLSRQPLQSGSDQACSGS